ncbi:hypothetical protein TWF506_006595 [Arthrobotrys conoides]|uniref:Transmembrane protein n=1 Tax=Arthrobotrys conoides TaxID=74498 RepID=A0AAN8NTZ4_9PEZI
MTDDSNHDFEHHEKPLLPQLLEQYHQDLLKIDDQHQQRQAKIAELGSQNPDHLRIVLSFNDTISKYAWTARILSSLAGASPIIYLYRRNMNKYNTAEAALGKPQVRHFRPVLGFYAAGTVLGMLVGATFGAMTVRYLAAQLHHKTRTENPVFREEADRISHLKELDRLITGRDQLSARIRLLEVGPTEAFVGLPKKTSAAEELLSQVLSKD